MPNSPELSSIWKQFDITLPLENSSIQNYTLIFCVVRYDPTDVLY